jgi:hypothetical protein
MNMRPRLGWAFAAVGLLVVVPQWADAAPEKAGPPMAEDLGDRLLGDWALPPSSTPQATPPTTQVPGVDESRKQLEARPDSGSEGEDIGEPGTAPLARISNRMSHAQRLIAAQTTDGETRKVQDAIVADLDALIEELSKQCKKCGGGQCDKPGQQQQTAQSAPKPGEGKKSGVGSSAQASAQQSQAPGGGGKAPNLRELSDEELVKRLWGQLPQHMRQQLLQSSADEFLPKYRAELEEYFRKLSEDERGEPKAW